MPRSTTRSSAPRPRPSLTKAGQPLADKTLYTVEGVLDENAYTLRQHRAHPGDRHDASPPARSTRSPPPTSSSTSSSIRSVLAPDPSIRRVQDGRVPRIRRTTLTTSWVPPTIQQVFLPIIKDDIAGGQALAAGQVDWKYSIDGGTYDEIKDNPDLKFVEYPDFGFFSLYFNLREGQRLRRQEDPPGGLAAASTRKPPRRRPRTAWVSRSTARSRRPRGPIRPKGLNKYPMDVAAGPRRSSRRRLDPRLRRDLREGRPEAVHDRRRPRRSPRPVASGCSWSADQVKECGIDIQFKEVDFGAILNMLTIYPHINAAAPETGKPFDAYFGGFSTGFDPDPYSLYHSSECSTAERPARTTTSATRTRRSTR